MGAHHDAAMHAVRPPRAGPRLSQLERCLCGRVARAPADEIMGWVEQRYQRYPQAVDASGECPPFLQWRNLLVELTSKSDHIPDDLSLALSDRVFCRLME